MTVPSEAIPAPVERDDLVWAREVLKVYRNLGQRGTARRLGSKSARYLHDWASNPENMEKFVSAMVPKATDIMAKNQKPEDSPELVVAEKRSILELKALLAEALSQSIVAPV